MVKERRWDMVRSVIGKSHGLSHHVVPQRSATSRYLQDAEFNMPPKVDMPLPSQQLFLLQ